MPSRRYNLPHLAFLQGFEAAARTLSFTKAAAELFVTQSAVSRQIKALEDNLGLKLFERRPRSLTLTEDGQSLYRIATDVLDRLQIAIDRLRAESRASQLPLPQRRDSLRCGSFRGSVASPRFTPISTCGSRRRPTCSILNEASSISPSAIASPKRCRRGRSDCS